MPITVKDVRKWLDMDEVDYLEARKLGPEAVPILLEMVQGGNLNLASKAAYLASMILGAPSVAVVQKAAASPEAVVRVAAASGLRNLSEADADSVLEVLHKDADHGVRKVALKAVSGFRSPALVTKVQKMAEQDPAPFVKELAVGALLKMRRK